MGKKKHKDKKSRKYNKNQFVAVYCTQCDLCHVNSEPVFCYTELFRQEPAIFTQEVFPNLLTKATDLETRNQKNLGISLVEFNETFCETGICHNGNKEQGRACPNKGECFEMFCEQAGSGPVGNKSSSFDMLVHQRSVKEISVKVRKKNKKEKVIFKPYATAFSSKNEDYRKEIERILYGNRSDSGEQNTSQESAGEVTRNPDRAAASGESEIHGGD